MSVIIHRGREVRIEQIIITVPVDLAVEVEVEQAGAEAAGDENIAQLQRLAVSSFVFLRFSV